MIDDLKKILKDVELNAEDNLAKEKSTWKIISDKSQYEYNTPGCRLVITTVVENVEPLAVNTMMFSIFKNTFTCVRMYGVNIINHKFERKHEVSIKNGIESEEEYFQLSTVYDFNGLRYEEYEVIQDIVAIVTEHAWSFYQ